MENKSSSEDEIRDVSTEVYLLINYIKAGVIPVNNDRIIANRLISLLGSDLATAAIKAFYRPLTRK